MIYNSSGLEPIDRVKERALADKRFFDRAGPFPLAAIGERLGAEQRVDNRETVIYDVASLDRAGPDDISVFTDVRYLPMLSATKAGAVITSKPLVQYLGSLTALVVKDPRLAFAQTGYLFYPATMPSPGIAASAVVHPTAVLAAGSQIDCGVVIEATAEIGRDCIVGHNTVIGRGVKLGDGVRIGCNCSISHATLGDRVEIASNVTIGSEGFGFVPAPTGLLRMIQTGTVRIGNDVKIGANCSIDRGTSGDTEIGDGSVLDNQVHIAHNVRIGRHCVICGQAGIAGSSVIGDRVMIGGQAGISDHLNIGAGSKVAAKSGVIRDVPPASIVGGYPAIPIRAWHRQTFGLAQLFASQALHVAKRLTK